MTSSIFMIKNIDTLLISIESLDLYAIDKLITTSRLIEITDLFIFRNNNLLKYNYQLNYATLYYIIIILNQIIHTSSLKYLRTNITTILKELSNRNINHLNYSLSTKLYINRFIINYRKKLKPYLVGYEKYNSEPWLIKISLINLLILYHLVQSKTLYKVFIYLKYNNKHA